MIDKSVIFATGNEGKMDEIRVILGGFFASIKSMKESGINLEIVEDGETFEENAMIKARAVAAAMPAGSDSLVLADDSGLEIDYLNKEPGVLSARYAGEDTGYPEKMQMLLDRLEGVPVEKRTARFVCAIAAILPDGRELCLRGTIEGMIGQESVGENGFGYDPIFYLPEYNCTTAQLPMEEKNRLSHRGKALRSMKRALEEIYENTDC